MNDNLNIASTPMHIFLIALKIVFMNHGFKEFSFDNSALKMAGDIFEEYDLICQNNRYTDSYIR